MYQVGCDAYRPHFGVGFCSEKLLEQPQPLKTLNAIAAVHPFQGTHLNLWSPLGAETHTPRLCRGLLNCTNGRRAKPSYNESHRSHSRNVSPNTVLLFDQCEETCILQLFERGQECDLNNPWKTADFNSSGNGCTVPDFRDAHIQKCGRTA